MKTVFTGSKIPIKTWLDEDDIEDNVFEQMSNLSNLPFAFHHIAIMPDCHLGYGMPIGGILATKRYVIPHAVGADIGCGMQATKLNIKDIPKEDLIEIVKLVKEQIPVGTNRHKEKTSLFNMPHEIKPNELISSGLIPMYGVIQNEFENARHQLGTLGSNNHFIEIQKGSDNHIWIMIHSGSRNLGYKIAKYYNKLAIKLNEENYSKVEKSWGLAFLALDSQIGKDYIQEMHYAVNYAKANRDLMMRTVIDIFDVESMNTYDIAHNYVAMEHHFGKNVLIHRKGATRAYKNEIGIIPGSQGTNSYIVEGLGNKDSFMSCSHGAGRLMGRNQAKKNLDLTTEQQKLDSLGVIHNMNSKAKLDEAPGAYKDIKSVMESQSDLVKSIVELTPLATVKG